MENRVSKIRERALRLVYDDSRNLPFEELLVKGNSVNIHQKISKLQLQKSLKQNKGFPRKYFQIYYNSLRNHTTLEIIPCCKGKKTKPFILALNISLSPKIWEIFPGPLKNEICLHSFKLKIRFWVIDKCPCRICKKYVGSVGFTIITNFI